MVVHCLKCEARYKVADARVTDKGAKIDCPRCSNRFVVFREQDVPAVATATVDALERIAFDQAGVRWEVRTPSGELLPFSNLATLRYLLQKGRVAKDASLRFGEESFIPLSVVENLDAYFWDVFERARNGHLGFAAPLMEDLDESLAVPEVDPYVSGVHAAPADDESTALDLDLRPPALLDPPARSAGAMAAGLAAEMADTDVAPLPSSPSGAIDSGAWVLSDTEGQESVDRSLEASGRHLPLDPSGVNSVVLRASQHSMAGSTGLGVGGRAILPILLAMFLMALALAITLPFALQALLGEGPAAPATITANPVRPAPAAESITSGVVVERPAAPEGPSAASVDGETAEPPADEQSGSGDPSGQGSDAPVEAPARASSSAPSTPSPKTKAPAAKRAAKSKPAAATSSPTKAEAPKKAEPTPEPPAASEPSIEAPGAADPFARPKSDLRDPFAN